MTGAAEIALATLIIAAGSIVQVVSGVGAGFLIVPLLAFVSLEFVPAPMILASIALSALMAWRERAHIHTEFFLPVMAGMLPGALLGALVLARVPFERLGIVFGIAILLAVALTASGLKLAPDRPRAIVAGAVAGAMGASSGIGAPVLALLFQHGTGPAVRATLALMYTGASLMVLALLALVGEFGSREALTGLMLVPGFALGYLASFRLARRFDAGPAARGAVLAVSALAALALILRSLGFGT